jgi:hypothetical protein
MNLFLFNDQKLRTGRVETLLAGLPVVTCPPPFACAIKTTPNAIVGLYSVELQ